MSDIILSILEAGWFWGFITALLLSCLGYRISFHFGRKSALQERLLGLYSDLVGASTTEVAVAQELYERVLSLSVAESEDRWRQIGVLVDNRIRNRRDIVRLAFQIKMLEKEEKLAGIVDRFRELRPIRIIWIPPQSDPASQERQAQLEKHKNDMKTLKCDTEKLTQQVRKTYAR